MCTNELEAGSLCKCHKCPQNLHNIQCNNTDVHINLAGKCEITRPLTLIFVGYAQMPLLWNRFSATSQMNVQCNECPGNAQHEHYCPYQCHHVNQIPLTLLSWSASRATLIFLWVIWLYPQIIWLSWPMDTSFLPLNFQERKDFCFGTPCPCMFCRYYPWWFGDFIFTQGIYIAMEYEISEIQLPTYSCNTYYICTCRWHSYFRYSATDIFCTLSWYWCPRISGFSWGIHLSAHSSCFFGYSDRKSVV